ncbi:uncharacterized protein TNCV_2173511 [Trichonephila clavipes]|nr:uncharacterized protein TNCV_2173511 [Trichonephila clavipes]
MIQITGGCFIDSSKLSLKAVLLNNGRLIPLIPIGHSIHMKETYANVKLLLELLKYEDRKWQICGDFKVIALLIGIQLWYTKQILLFSVFVGQIDRESHYIQDKWPSRNLKSGERNVPNDPLVNPNDILFPSLHIKLELMKNFLKSINKDGEAFQ